MKRDLGGLAVFLAFIIWFIGPLLVSFIALFALTKSPIASAIMAVFVEFGFIVAVYATAR